jgi:DNA-binding PadR family transcriptional regulator
VSKDDLDIRGKLRLLILLILSDGPKHGYLIMKEIEKLTGRPPSPGSVYPVLNELLRRGYVEVSASRVGARVQKTYFITETGRKHLEENRKLAIKVMRRFKGFSMLRELGLEELQEALKELAEALVDVNDDVKLIYVKKIISECSQKILLARDLVTGAGLRNSISLVREEIAREISPNPAAEAEEADVEPRDL